MIASLLVSALAAALPAGSCCSTTESARVDSVLASEMRRLRAPGVSMVVTQGGRVVLSRTIGVRSVETNDPVTRRTLFRIGSVTKSITGLTAATLVHDGRLDLDAPIGRYASGLAPDLARLTMRQLLSHTAGMVNLGAGTGSHDHEALERRVRGWTSNEIFAPPGDVYSYSSPGYWLAGHVLAQITRGTYTEAARKAVLAPLGMAQAGFEPTLAMTHPLAVDHRRAGDSLVVLRPYPDDASTWPSGSLFASADELARVGMALADSGRVEGRAALPAAVIRLVSTRHAPSPGPDSARCGYGLGLSTCAEGAAPVLKHYGFRSGSGAVMTILPAQRASVVILANGPGAIMSETERVVLEILMGGPQPRAAADPKPVAAPSLPAAMLGTYVSGADTLSLLARGDSARYRYRQMPPQPARLLDDGSVGVLSASGDVQQQFFVVRGRSGQRYLHDGLNAFRKLR
jgi:CubicO group peptidase (beta-lactamase class C family)